MHLSLQLGTQPTLRTHCHPNDIKYLYSRLLQHIRFCSDILYRYSTSPSQLAASTATQTILNISTADYFNKFDSVAIFFIAQHGTQPTRHIHCHPNDIKYLYSQLPQAI
jgi:hypothetical protein